MVMAGEEENERLVYILPLLIRYNIISFVNKKINKTIEYINLH